MDREWKRWKRNFQYFISANGITDAQRKKQLLLLFAGEQVQEVFENLKVEKPQEGPLADKFVDAYQSVVDRLDGHFASKINVSDTFFIKCGKRQMKRWTNS